MRVGILSGRQDLIERGVAAAHASLTLINHPRLIQNNIYKYPNYPLGLGPENIDHEGFPQMPLRSGPSWCETGGLAGAAHLMRQLGSLYVNPEKNIALGTDGISVKSFNINGKRLELNLESLISKDKLKIPWENRFIGVMKIDSQKEWNVVINGREFKGKVNGIEFIVMPDGSFSQ